MSLESWALPQLSRLLELDDESLKQIIAYTDTLPRQEAAEHLKNLLGDTPQAFEFVSSFNSRRPNPPSELVERALDTTSRDVSEDSEVPRTTRKPKKKKQPLNKLPPPRQPEGYGNVTGGYLKRNDDDYIAAAKSKSNKDSQLVGSLALQEDPEAQQSPSTTSVVSRSGKTMKLPPSAAGSLISDDKRSRSSSPATKQKAKINVSGGTSMRGQSSTLNDLDSAIRALESQTNPTLSSQQDDAARRCNCMAQRHELLGAAPNCLNCGKIVCAKEGIGPCTFCGKPLLSSHEIQEMVKALREERGKEKMEVNNAAHKRPEVSTTPRPFSSSRNTPVSSAPSSDSESDKLAAAKQHRDKLLKFQAENARRTQIRDEAADFETPDAGQSIWATPQERALQLKRQQKVLREQEWNAKPDYEKRQMVVSIDVVGGKAVRKMAPVERTKEKDSRGHEEDESLISEEQPTNGGGSFSNNPLLGELIRPVYPSMGKGKGKKVENKITWRRVQDDYEDNEDMILDGGIFGDRIDGRVLGSEEHAVS